MEHYITLKNNVNEISPLTLAFVGDGVYDLMVREYLVSLGNRPVGELNKMKVSLVNCASQSRFSKMILPHLNEKETAVFKRGRNAAPKCTPKNSSVADYHAATGLECLCGYLYLDGQDKRLKEIFSLILHMTFDSEGD